MSWARREKYYMTKREQVPQPCTTSYYQVKIPFKNKRSGYSSYSFKSRNEHISSRDLNNNNETVQLSNISFHEELSNSS